MATLLAVAKVTNVAAKLGNKSREIVPNDHIACVRGLCLASWVIRVWINVAPKLPMY